MTDIDDFTDYTEPCHCGHSRRKHGNLPGCSGTRTDIDRDALPAPEYSDPDSPFEWPNNWPGINDVPRVTRPCGCAGFTPADPEPPEEY